VVASGGCRLRRPPLPAPSGLPNSKSGHVAVARPRARSPRSIARAHARARVVPGRNGAGAALPRAQDTRCLSPPHLPHDC
jgi:hypothetical protein